MVKFSIIVPVYNVYEYLDRCLESIYMQSYGNYEVIIVDDGSPDDSYKIINKYNKKDKRFKGYKKKNGGLSDARNYGVSKASGDYLLFIDGDDSVNKDLLYMLANEINKLDNYLDVIRFKINVINNKREYVSNNHVFSYIDGEDAFKRLIANDLFVTAWSYAYRLSFWIDNNFSYEVSRLHEDFGLTPYIIVKANCVSSIDYVGYNYFIRDNSIMTSKSRSKIKKMITDSLFLFDKLLALIDEDTYVSTDTKIIFKSYIANIIIDKSKILFSDMIDDYIYELKKRGISNYLLNDSIIRKLKKFLFKLFPKLYIKFIVKR